jgi:hypothetical protein
MKQSRMRPRRTAKYSQESALAAELRPLAAVEDQLLGAVLAVVLCPPPGGTRVCYLRAHAVTYVTEALRHSLEALVCDFP